MLTAALLRSLIHYDPSSGIFVWRVRRSTAEPGSVAGRVSVRGYRDIGLLGTKYRAARLAWLYMMGQWPNGEVDHINRQKDDNRWINLREATRQQNLFNTGVRVKNKSGIVGVFYDKRRDTWAATIGRKRLGNFNSKEEAIAKRHEAEKAVAGEFSAKEIA